jgi:hypothetical protein
MFSELTVIVKDDDGRVLKNKYPIYDAYQVDETDPVIKDCVDKTLKEFQGSPTDISVKISMELL